MNTRRILLVFCGIWVAIAWSLSTVTGRDRQERGMLFMPDMLDQPSYKAFESNESFADGRTLRGPVPGAIARGRMPFTYAATPEGALAAGQDLKSPVDLGAANVLARGASAFAGYCAACHGASGDGDGQATKRGVPPPPNLKGDAARTMADGAIYHIITLGRGNMPAHAAQVTRLDRWRIIAHIRQLQKEAN